MQVGFTPTRKDLKPRDVTTLILGAGSSYEISNPMTWHSVIPLEPTYTVMVNGLPWPTTYAHPSVRTTKGKDLDSFNNEELQLHLDIFKGLVLSHNLFKTNFEI